MLLLWRDKPLYLSVIAGQCHWLFIHAGEYRSGQFDCNVEDIDWAMQLWTTLQKLHLPFNSLRMTFPSELCRFAILPAQQMWPRPDVLGFLANQMFKRQFPDYEQSTYSVVTDQIRFRQPALLMAVPVNLYNGINGLKQKIPVLDALPVLVRVWNQILLQGDGIFVYTERHLSFYIEFAQGYPFSINALPAIFLSGAGEGQYAVRLDNLAENMAMLPQPKSLSAEVWQKIKQSPSLMATYHQQLNLMSLS